MNRSPAVCYFATLLTASCLSTPTVDAAPMLGFVDNLDGSVTLQVITDAAGSVATEIGVTGGISASGGLQFTGASIADPAVFDTATPGNNPFTAGVTVGLFLDNLASNEIFASFGSGVLGVGVFDFLDINFVGTGTIDAFGLVAQQGVNNTGLTASIDVSFIPEPSCALLACLGSLACLATRR